jgi:hypothetical protein
VRVPRIPTRLSAVDLVVGPMVVVLMVKPSMPLALAVAALVGARALERYFVDLARVYRNSSIGAATDAAAAAASAKAAADGVQALEKELGARLTRLETRAGWENGARTGGGR